MLYCTTSVMEECLGFSGRAVWIVLFTLLFSEASWAWGGAGHRFINGKAVINLPAFMAQLASQQSFLVAHASDADTRKSSDTAEYPKHFLDLELYPDYQNLPADLSLLIAQYGWSTVRTNGILPWATVWTLDSLTARFRRGDWAGAYQAAADLGHYVADASQPLHCTANYDGQLTGNGGIHSRYETQMINLYEASLNVGADSVRYISDPHAYALSYLISSNLLVDSILQADDAAKAVSGWNGSGQAPSSYYAALWERVGGLTNRQMQKATGTLASLWYTAWVNAGLIATEIASEQTMQPENFLLLQNFPNPFNPVTVISGQWSVASTVKLVVYDVLGREVVTLADGPYAPGKYEFTFNAAALPSGVYLARIQAGTFTAVRRMILLR